MAGNRLRRRRRRAGVAHLSGSKAAPLVAVLAAAPLLFAALGGAPFDDPGEGMHAEIARELSLSGDPLALTLNGVRYVDKPPLFYVLLAAVFALGGEHEGGARAVSAGAALIAVAAVAWLATRLLDPASGVVAGLALATSTGFFAYGRYVRVETVFLAMLSVGLALTLVGVREGRRAFVIAGLAAFGVAGLTKDPLGAVAPPLAVGLALRFCGRARPLARWLPWPGLAALLVVGLAWYALDALTTPGFAWYTVVDNKLLNVARARVFPDEDVPLGAAEFLAVALLGAVPWIVPAGGALWVWARRRGWRDPDEVAWSALTIVAVGVIGLTVLSPFRLPHYGLPAYPAIALLAARGWHELNARALATAHAALFAVLGAGCAWLASPLGGAALGDVLGATDVAARKAVAAGAVSPLPPPTMLRPLLLAAALVFTAGAVLAAITAALGAGRRRLGAFVVVAAMLALMPVIASALARVSAYRSVKPIAVALARRAGPEDVVVHEGPIENSGALEWYSGRRPVLLDGRRSVLGFGATLADAPDVFWDEARLAVVWRDQRVWLVTGRPREQSVTRSLPGARLVTSAGGRRLYVNR
ncbi:MAG: ArnT family glycosyltransferase [Candidatus Rokuibacteriota bacterium]